jgi:membrane-associated protein
MLAAAVAPHLAGDPLGFVHQASGLVALIVICVLLFAEEAGVPVPFAPGEVVVIAAGVLIASGAVAWPVVAVCTYAAVLGGAAVGFAWARAVGPERLRRIAERVGAGNAFGRIVERLSGAGALQLAGTRLVPGLRIYTTLVAGAVGVTWRRFAIGIGSASLGWTVVLLGLGVFVGVPATQFLGQAEAVASRALVVLAILIVCYLLLRRVPRVQRAGVRLEMKATGLRLVALLAVDLMVVLAVTAVLGLATGLESGDVGSVVTVVLVVGSISLVYMLAARRSFGYTVAELLFRVHYP